MNEERQQEISKAYDIGYEKGATDVENTEHIVVERVGKERKRDFWIGLGWIILFIIFACGMIFHVKSKTYKNYMDYKTWFENLYVENGEIKEQNEILLAENEELTIRLDELTSKYNDLVRDYNSIAMVKLESEE